MNKHKMCIYLKSVKRKYPDIITRRAVMKKFRRRNKIFKERRAVEKDTDISHKNRLFDGALYGVEHALGLYATSYCSLPAEFIYDKEALKQYQHVIKSCHIYLIGYLPRCETESVYLDNNDFVMDVSALGKTYKLAWPIPDGFKLKQEGEYHFCENGSGERISISESQVIKRLQFVSKEMNFQVKYIGQAYGKNGSRNALDRLLKHETLQKISLKGVPSGYRLSLLLLEVEPNPQLLTVIIPNAKDKESDADRIKAGIDKLYNTSDQERITLYEASLIRYFMPEYNKEFKHSFPSTNLKVLQDCYDKDFSSVVAEICINELPYNLCSESVKPKSSHIASHDLHAEKERKVFFCL